MLSKQKRRIIQMIDTLYDAVAYLFQMSAEIDNNFVDDMASVIVTINNVIALKNESDEAIAIGRQLSELIKAYAGEGSQEEIINAIESYTRAIDVIPVQYKVVFLPYYDNTWDSLESVYEAFAEDPMFETEIVIVPIVRNSLTGFVFVYEDYLSPMGIPNTHYDKYDFKEDEPDFCFFCNPYNAVNIPKYNPENFKPDVGCLIYIPYYICKHEYVNPNDFTKKLERRTGLPGHDSADIIITLGKPFMKNYAKKSRNGKKMVPLGSPKADYLFKHKTNNTWQRYPEWESKIKDKKVFLLNTHYSTLSFGEPHSSIKLSSTHSWLKFLMEYIASDDDMALIWRPHPQTFIVWSHLNKEQQEQGLNDLMGNVKCERIIIDRTPSVVSAFMYCDAVLTENSSIISEAVCIDKPTFVLSIDPREQEKNEKNYYTPAYNNTLKKTRQVDSGHLTYQTALPCFGLDRGLKKGEDLQKSMYHIPLTRFMESIKNGEDPKAALRREYCKQFINNLDGKCGAAILDYIKGSFEEV